MATPDEPPHPPFFPHATDGELVSAAQLALQDGDLETAGMLVADALSRTESTVVSARVPNATAQRFAALAEHYGVAPGALARTIITHAIEPTGAGLAKIAGLIDLDDAATLDDVIARLRELYPSSVTPADDNAISGSPLAPASISLTDRERAYIRKHGITPDDFAARKRAAVRTDGVHTAAPARSPSPVVRKLTRAEEAYCRKHNLTREQFEARKREVVKGSR